MSTYNLMNGYNIVGALFILPMLGKHADKYPRFRDCFSGALENDSKEKDQYGIPKKKTSDEEVISVYTGVGGGNREHYQKEIDELREMPGYIRDYDDDFDSTFAIFIFSVPDKWKEDFVKLAAGDMTGIRKEYQEQIRGVYPNLTDKLELFNSK